MKAVILDGAAPGDESVARVAAAAERVAVDAGCEAIRFPLRDLDIRPCVGCFGCWVRTPGRCAIPDDAPSVAEAAIDGDLLALVTRVTFGGYGSTLKLALDRMICLVLPFFERIDGKVHHRPRYAKYPALFGVGFLDRADEDAESIFTDLVRRNSVNLHSPARAVAVIHAGEDPDPELRERVDRLMAESAP